MISTLLKREDEDGIYRVFYLSGVHAQDKPEGVYADIAYHDGSGYSRRCKNYQEAANRVFSAHGPDE